MVDTPETHFMIFNRQGDVVSSSNDNSDNMHDYMVDILNMISTNHTHPNNKPTKPTMSSKVKHIINTCQLVPSDGNPCAICLIKDNDRVLFKCGHNFHPTCILQWGERSNTCPTCRSVMSVMVVDLPKVFYYDDVVGCLQPSLFCYDNKMSE